MPLPISAPLPPFRFTGPGARGRFRPLWLTGMALVSLMLLLVTSASTACGKTVTLPRAMWVWNTPSASKLMTFAVQKKVGELYIYVHTGSFTGSSLSWLREVRNRANAAGIRLSALGGEPDWVYDHAAAVRWRRAVLDSGLFSASHIDVEPHVLAEWKFDQAGVMRSYIGMLTAVRGAGTARTITPARTPDGTSAKASAGRRGITGKFYDARPLEADVAFWYGTLSGTGTGGTFGDEILRLVDSITVMSYRDRATGDHSIMAVGTDFLRRATAAGKSIRLGAETNRDVECPSCTFYEEGGRRLAGALDTVDTVASEYSGYQGMAVHDYAGWTRLRR